VVWARTLRREALGRTRLSEVGTVLSLLGETRTPGVRRAAVSLVWLSAYPIGPRGHSAPRCTLLLKPEPVSVFRSLLLLAGLDREGAVGDYHIRVRDSVLYPWTRE
jgi:hypothetical protein